MVQSVLNQQLSKQTFQFHYKDRATYNCFFFFPCSISKPISVFHIVVVACGQRLQETLVMIKSCLLFNHSKEMLKFVIFTEDNLRSEFNEKLTDWHNLMPKEFQFELKSLRFPQHHEKEWKSLFKPCAAQRLFLPVRFIVHCFNDYDNLFFLVSAW